MKDKDKNRRPGVNKMGNGRNRTSDRSKPIEVIGIVDFHGGEFYFLIGMKRYGMINADYIHYEHLREMFRKFVGKQEEADSPKRLFTPKSN